MIKKLLKPYMYVKDVFSIDYRKLQQEGIKGIMFDIDNTLINYEQHTVDEKLLELFKDLNDRGFKVALVSNGPQKRVEKFNLDLSIFALHRALKPSRRGLKKAIKSMKIERKQAVIVGDQIFTDVLAANRLGIKSVLVQPIKPKDSWGEIKKRIIEKKLLKKFEM